MSEKPKSIREALNKLASLSAKNIGLSDSGRAIEEMIEESLQGIEVPQAELWAPGEVEFTIKQVAAAATKTRENVILDNTRVINYDELTEEQRRKLASSIAGSDEEDERKAREYDEAESRGEFDQPLER